MDDSVIEKWEQEEDNEINAESFQVIRKVAYDDTEQISEEKNKGQLYVFHISYLWSFNHFMFGRNCKTKVYESVAFKPRCRSTG